MLEDLEGGIADNLSFEGGDDDIDDLLDELDNIGDKPKYTRQKEEKRRTSEES